MGFFSLNFLICQKANGNVSKTDIVFDFRKNPLSEEHTNN